ncbi:MAG: DUF2142 domain-containing protein [Thermaerobacter sp.]|nr:DUF2142 domain-containing protein [Thermaerobacter sp.]
MEKVRMAEILVVFGLFFALGLSWMGIMPLWQGADEPAHFAYVQYMADHVLPPVQHVVAPGQHPWEFSASPAETVALQATHRNRLLAGPQGWLATTPSEAARVARTVSRASAAAGGDRAGSQNYVGIYPPLYYAAIGRTASWLHIQNVFDQAFMARGFSAGLLGLTGIFIDLVVGLVIPTRRLRVALTAAFGLLFPTLGMLGGTIGNDLTADAASLVVFYLTVRAMTAQTIRAGTAALFGAVAGLVIWTKEEAYVGLAVSVPFVLHALWRRVGPRRAWRWTAAAVAIGTLIAGPWLWFTWHAYHAIVPPLTYQGAATAPRTVAWVLHYQFFNGAYLRNLLVGETVFGIVWWNPWSLNLGVFTVMAVTYGALLVGGLVVAVKRPGYWVAIAWLVVGLAVLGVLQVSYAAATGLSFLQGRYFFFLLGPFFWLAAQAIRRIAWVATPILLAGAATLSGMVANATLQRFYHAGLAAYLTGRTVPFGPARALLLSRVATVVVAVAVLAVLGSLIAATVRRSKGRVANSSLPARSGPAG